MVVVLNLMDRPGIYRLAKPMQAAQMPAWCARWLGC